MLLYEELLPLVDNFILTLVFLTIIGFFVSLYLLYKFNDYGRQLLIVTYMILIIFALIFMLFLLYRPSKNSFIKEYLPG